MRCLPFLLVGEPSLSVKRGASKIPWDAPTRASRVAGSKAFHSVYVGGVGMS